jgi:hypothetical protein
LKLLQFASILPRYWVIDKEISVLLPALASITPAISGCQTSRARPLFYAGFTAASVIALGLPLPRRGLAHTPMHAAPISGPGSTPVSSGSAQVKSIGFLWFMSHFRP